MDTALPQKFPFILDRNLAKANCTEDQVCTSCDKVVLGQNMKLVCMWIVVPWISILYTDWFYAFCDTQNKAKLF